MLQKYIEAGSCIIEKCSSFYGSSKMFLVHILNYKGAILSPIGVKSLEGDCVFLSSSLKFSKFTFFPLCNFTFVKNLGVFIISYDTNVLKHT